MKLPFWRSPSSPANGPGGDSRRVLMGAAALGALFAGGLVGEAFLHTATSPGSAPISVGGAAATQSMSFADIAAKVKPAVVSVQARIVDDEPGEDEAGPDPFGDMFREFGIPTPPPQPQRREGVSLGSGFFISADGYIVTNNHVVKGAQKVTVALDDGREIDARVVAVDPRSDLALLKTGKGANYPYVRFAAKEPRVGDWVLAVGNPFGLGGTVTAGIVSAHHRDIGEGPYTEFLQIDAPVNQGNSGGPSFNLAGEVVGINTAIYAPSGGGNVGIAFAIPSDSAAPVVRALENGKRIERGYLGVLVQPIDDDIAQSLGRGDHAGALVANVSNDSPASRAGLKQGDLILSVDGKPISTSRDLARVVAGKAPGSRVDIEYYRAGRAQRTSAALGVLKDDAEQRPIPARADGDEGPSTSGMTLGMALAPTHGGLGVTSVAPGSPAEERGLGPGDVILEADGAPVDKLSALDRAIAEVKREGRSAILLRVASADGGGVRFVGVPLG